ncbi:MAG: hypothetical protein AAF290_01635 [Pseudomonadota bacterium]
MLLRRISKHIKDQNWFAVGIDFFIVVIGVFIGIQVANWNDLKGNQSELRASLDRLDKETTINIELVDEVLTYYVEGRADMNLGRETLDRCSMSAEGQAALERLLFDFVQDVQPNFATHALDQVSNHGRYQELLSEDFQQDFGRYAGRLKEEHEQLASHYDNMWRYHVNYHPDVDAYFSGDNGDSEEYKGWGFRLDKPLAEVCTNASFRNRFINTLGFYDAIGRRLRFFKSETERFQASLRQEMRRH